MKLVADFIRFVEESELKRHFTMAAHGDSTTEGAPNQAMDELNEHHVGTTKRDLLAG